MPIWRAAGESERERACVEAGEVGRFESGDLVGAGQRARDVVEAVDERLLRMRVEREVQLEPVRVRDAQVLEVDRQLVPSRDRLLDPRELLDRQRDLRIEF